MTTRRPSDADPDDIMTPTGIYLLGLRGSGKTSLGEELALQLEYQHVDLDKCIAQGEGRSIGEVLQDSGEEMFRKIEHRHLKFELEGLLKGRQVLSLGGGSIEDPEIRQILKMLRTEKNWVGVWVECEPHELERRIRMSGATEVRPRLVGRGVLEEQRLLLSKRARYYRDLSDVRFRNPGGRLEKRAAELIRMLGKVTQA